MPESRLGEQFVDEKWGDYYRCLHGPIEHCHYHLGQIALIQSVRYLTRQNIRGCFVECGVWRGGSSMAMALALGLDPALPEPLRG